MFNRFSEIKILNAFSEKYTFYEQSVKKIVPSPKYMVIFIIKLFTYNILCCECNELLV